MLIADCGNFGHKRLFIWTQELFYDFQVYSGDIFKEGPAADAIVSKT